MTLGPWGWRRHGCINSRRRRQQPRQLVKPNVDLRFLHRQTPLLRSIDLIDDRRGWLCVLVSRGARPVWDRRRPRCKPQLSGLRDDGGAISAHLRGMPLASSLLPTVSASDFSRGVIAPRASAMTQAISLNFALPEGVVDTSLAAAPIASEATTQMWSVIWVRSAGGGEGENSPSGQESMRFARARRPSSIAVVEFLGPEANHAVRGQRY